MSRLVDFSMVQRMQGKRVLVLGDIMLDAYWIGDAERISPEAPVPVVKVEKKRFLLGGAGNVARNITALGGQATLIGSIGRDSAAERVQTLVREEGIRPVLIPFPNRPTTVKTRIMARRQQMLRLDQEDSTPCTRQELDLLLPVLAEELRQHDVMILSDYSKGLVTNESMQEIRKLIKNNPHPVRVLVDPKPSNTALYTEAFLMTPNTRETGECAGMPVGSREEVLAAGRSLLARIGCPHLLTTLGADGMALFEDTDTVWHVPTMAQDVFDVTGAGDTVIATLGLGLAAGLELLPACVLANYAAGLVVAQVGAAVATPQTLAAALEHLPAPQISRWA